MPEHLFTFRFDVDSHRCVAEGMPALLDLAADLQVPFTFFVNFGRLTSRPRALRAALARRGAATPTTAEVVHKLPLRRKLGPWGLAVATLANPRAGANHLDVVHRAVDEGHEVGLHGGRSHRVWQEGAATWAADRIDAEIRWGRQFLDPIGGTAGRGFSSPGWSSSPTVARVVAEHGFAYLADRHGAQEHTVHRHPTGLADVPTNLVGEPGGVGWLEWRRALGDDDHDVARRFRARLDGLTQVGRAIVYDHPFHAGIEDLHLVRRLVDVARDAGWHQVPMARLAADPVDEEPG